MRPSKQIIEKNVHNQRNLLFDVYFLRLIARPAVEALGVSAVGGVSNVAPFSCLLLVSSSKASCNCLEIGGREVTMLLLFFFFFSCQISWFVFDVSSTVRCWSALLCLLVCFFGAAHYEKNNKKIGDNFVEYCSKISNMLTWIWIVFEQKYIEFLYQI